MIAGKFFSSSGVSVEIDLSLAVMAQLISPELADQVETFAEYEWHRDQSCDPFAKLHGLVDD